ncbi:MAG: GNAT family N-acetyltransferase [Candidatus Heimdallarchaeota archaeon]|nr:GNAT family N-acetyltransferase [Candidatus Heimdallarchaeota archaeon]
MFEIVKLEDIDIQKFWDYVLKDIPGYFFFILDQKQYPESSQFLIALEEENIVGICLIWQKSIVHVRCHDEEIVKALYDAIPKDLTITQINFPIQHKELLHSLVPKPKYNISQHRMLLKKENMIPRFQLDKPFTQRVLTKEDAEEIAKLCAKADPFYWGKMKAEIFVFNENQIYTGLFDGKKLISFTLAWIDASAAIISTAATLPKYQNQGLATYLVNESVHRMMEDTEIAIIHVVTDNAPAIKVYSKVGYEVYATYEMVGIGD